MNLEDLEQKARAATPGPWNLEVSQEYKSPYFWIGPGRKVLCETVDMATREDADFIASFNPTTVLELIEALKEAREALSYYVKAMGCDSIMTDEGDVIHAEVAQDWLKRFGGNE